MSQEVKLIWQSIIVAAIKESCIEEIRRIKYVNDPVVTKVSLEPSSNLAGIEPS